MKRPIRLAAAAALLMASAAAPQAQSMPATVDQPVEITYYNYNLASAGLGADATKKLIAEFEAANPNVKVKGVGVPSTEMTGRIQSDVAVGRGPDVAQVIFDSLSFAAENLGAHALEDVVPAEEISAHLSGMSPNGVALGVIDNKTWALAYTFSTPVLFYNADLFRQAGLDPDHPPQTWAEIKEAALAVQAKTGKHGFASLMISSGGDDWMVQSLLLSNGGRAMSKDRKTLTFADPPSVEAVATLRDLADAGLYENIPYQSALEQMASSDVAMFLTTSVFQAVLLKGAEGKYDLRDTVMPGFGTKPAVPTNSGSGLMMLTADPVKQRAVWEFMKFMTSKRAYTVITSEIGYVPLRPEIVNDPQYLGDWIKDHPLVQPNLDQLDRMQPWESFPGPNYRQIRKIMMDAVETAIFGGVDVAATLKDAQDLGQSMMPQ